MITSTHKVIKRDKYLDSAKGFLILCIVLQHNSLLTNVYDWIRPFCDAFAAGCFLLLTFTRPINNLPLKKFINKNFNHWWPFFIFLSGTSILNFIFYENNNLYLFFTNYLKALFFASPADIKVASGFMYLWFLPCLCSLYLIRLFAFKFEIIALIISFVTWLSVGLVDDDLLTKAPLSLHVVSFIFFIGICYQRIHKRLISHHWLPKYFCIISFILCSIISYIVGWELFLAGGIIPSIFEPALLFYYTFFMLIAIPGIYHISSLLPSFAVDSLSIVGKDSLIIYLIHPLVFVSITQVFKIINQPYISFFLTILLSLIFARLLHLAPSLFNFIFPKQIDMIFRKRNL